ncbi:hypothetical protein [Corynebacterium sputi]|uniref:hypothetical protein n=1 Tax=Corynebacterium sputi TaxID=489915 RepID=UPI00047E2042|nr:hypothetical protein [Corynebacterium sputi]
MTEHEKRDDEYLMKIAKNRVSIFQPKALVILVMGLVIGVVIGLRSDALLNTIGFWVFAIVLAVVLNVILVKRGRRELLSDLKESSPHQA